MNDVYWFRIILYHPVFEIYLLIMLIISCGHFGLFRIFVLRMSYTCLIYAFM